MGVEDRVGRNASFFEYAKYEDLLGHLDRGDQMTGKEMGLELMWVILSLNLDVLIYQ